MSYELYQQGPSVYGPALFVSLIITLFAYGAFPVIFAKTRNAPITQKKYTRLCYGVNFAVLFVFIIINGGATNGGPYLLWTWIFTSYGKKLLSKYGVMTDEKRPAERPSPPTVSGWQCSCGRVHPQYETSCICGKAKRDNIAQATSSEVVDPILFCRKCGHKLSENSRFCTKCGTKIVRDF